MIIDVHVHLMPKEVRADRARFCAGDPAFAMLYNSEKAKVVSEQEIIDYLDKSGIDKAVVFGFPWEDPELIEQNNDEVWNFHRSFPDRIIPFAVLPAGRWDAAARETERTLRGGFAGLGELATYHGGWKAEDFEALDPCFALAGEIGAPVLVHLNEQVGHAYPGKIAIDFDGLLAAVKRRQEVNFILAHFGGGVFFYALMPEIARTFGRVWLDTAASPFLYDPRIFDVAARILGPEKILFGSDYPLLPLSRYVKELDKGGIDGDFRAAILGGNASALFSTR